MQNEKEKKMTESEALEKLKAYLKCQERQVSGICSEHDDGKCNNCNLCYEQGTTGEHIKSVKMAIQALESQIQKK